MSTRRDRIVRTCCPSPRPRPAGRPLAPGAASPRARWACTGRPRSGRHGPLRPARLARSGTARPRARPPARRAARRGGAPARARPSGGRPPSAVERGRDVDRADGLDQVRRRRALAEQHHVLGPRQRRARARSRRGRPPPAAGRRAGGTRAGRPTRGRRAGARARTPRRSRSAAGRPGRPAAPTSGGARARAARASAGPDARRNSAHGPSGCRQRYCVGDSSVMRWKRPATRLGSVRSGRRHDASRKAGTRSAVTRTRCSGSSPPRAAGRAGARDRRAATAASRRPARAAASRTTRPRPRA